MDFAGRAADIPTTEKWPSLLADSEVLARSVDDDHLFQTWEGEQDAEASIESILCALSVAPDWDPTVRAALLGALRVRYAQVIQDPATYPPDLYPWREATNPKVEALRSRDSGHHGGSVPDSQEK